jgi:3-phosphoshikimate 1-carboxyvinyltransferase
VGTRPGSTGPARGTVALPGGKSGAIRALLLAAQAKGESRIVGFSPSGDVASAVAWLRAGNVKITEGAGEIRVAGLGGAPRIGGAFDARDAGAVLRMGLVWCSAGTGNAQISGSARLAQRPIAEGLALLRALGVTITGDRLPLELRARGIRGGFLEARAEETSQFISGMLLCAPCFEQGLKLSLSASGPSGDYVKQTLAVMTQFGIAWREAAAEPQPAGALLAAGMPQFPGGAIGASQQKTTVEVRPGVFDAAEVRVRPDPSHTLLFASAAAILGGETQLIGDASPEDRGLAALAAAGAAVAKAGGGIRVAGKLSSPFDFDADPDPDLAIPIAIAAVFAPGQTWIRNVSRLRGKESDRLAALCEAIAALGGKAETVERPTGSLGPVATATDLRIDPPATPRAAKLRTLGDHRLAMAYGLAALALPGTELDDESCVSKSMPDYWQRLRRAIGR